MTNILICFLYDPNGLNYCRKESNMRSKFVFSLIALLSVLVLFTGCINKSDGNVLCVYTDECSENRIIKTVNVSGSVESTDSGVYTVSTKIKEYCIKSLNIRVGDEVKKGDIICEFETADLDKEISEIEERLKNVESSDEQVIYGMNQKINILNELLNIKLNKIEADMKSDQRRYDEAEQNYNDARSELESMKNEYEDASANLTNASSDEVDYYSSLCENLLEKISSKSTAMETYYSLMSQIQARLDDYQYQIDLAKQQSQKEIAEVQLSIDTYTSNDELKDKLRELKDTLENSTIYAPCSGIVKSVNVTNGQISSESDLVTIVEADKKTIHSCLSDSDFTLVKEGMKVEVTIGSETFNGEIVRVNHIKNEEGFDIYIDGSDFKNASIGMKTTNSIIIFDKELLSVDINSVIEENGSNFVYVAVPQSDGTYIVESKMVTVGVKDDVHAEICSGISKGDLVVTDQLEYLYDGMCVNIMQSVDVE